MLFASVVAENANRRSRLSFPTPPHVPAPTTKEQLELDPKPQSIAELMRFPSWMENTDDPFGPDPFSSTLYVPSLSTKSAVLGSVTNAANVPRPQSAAAARAKPCVSNADATGLDTPSRVSTEIIKLQKPIRRKHRPISAASSGATDVRINPPYNPLSKRNSMPVKPPVVPMPPSLIASEDAMPLLGTLTISTDATQRTLAKWRACPETAEGAQVALSVALSEGRYKQPSRKSHAPKNHQFSSGTFIGLATHKIPQTPFNPFGDVYEFPLAQVSDDIAKAESSSGSWSQESPVAAGATASEEHSMVLDNEDLDSQFVFYDARSKQDSSVSTEAGIEERETPEYSGPLIAALSTVKRDNKGVGTGIGAAPKRPPWKRSHELSGSIAAIRTSSFHHSFMDLRYRSLTMLERATRSDRGGSRSSSPTSFMTDAQYSSEGEDDDDDDDDDEIEVHMADVAQHGQAWQAPLVTSEHASPVHENGPPCGSPLPFADFVSTDERPQLSRSTSIGLRRAVMGKIRKLTHLKKGSSD